MPPVFATGSGALEPRHATKAINENETVSARFKCRLPGEAADTAPVQVWSLYFPPLLPALEKGSLVQRTQGKPPDKLPMRQRSALFGDYAAESSASHTNRAVTRAKAGTLKRSCALAHEPAGKPLRQPARSLNAGRKSAAREQIIDRKAPRGHLR